MDYDKDGSVESATATLDRSAFADASPSSETEQAQVGRESHDSPVENVPLIAHHEMSVPLNTAIRLLFQAASFARESEGDLWQFAVEWRELRRLGLTCNDGRRLIYHRIVRQAREVTTVRDELRRFVPCPNLSLARSTCFTLTPRGERFAQSLGVQPELVPANASHPTEAQPPPTTVTVTDKPLWDRDRRQLRLGDVIIKEFKVPATNQEIVLAVFQEEDWPPKIDDPLPRKSDIDPQRRLHDTINSLNRRQRRQLIHFGADGLARGIRWELVASS